MQLTFSRASLVRLIGVFAGLAAFFAAGTLYAVWAHRSDARGLFMMALGPICVLICAWVAGYTARALCSNVPAAVVTSDGIQVFTFTTRKTLPWEGIKRIFRSTAVVGKRSIDVIEITTDGRQPVRISTSMLTQSSSEIDRWVDSVQARLPVATQ